MKRFSRTAFAFLGLYFCLFVTAQVGWCQIVMPHFAVVGQKGEDIGRLWKENAGGRVFPKQIAVDFNERGVVYGFVCEYWWNQDVFTGIKATLEKSIKAKQKSLSKNYFVWRDEDQKLAISLFQDKESNTIKLIVVSTDAAIRGKSDKAEQSAK